MISNKLISDQLAALGHHVRLSIATLLVRYGPQGMPAGQIGEQLSVPPNALNFHLQKLKQVDLLTSQRQGKHIYYSVIFENLRGITDFLLGTCCVDSAEKCDDQCLN